LVSDIKEKHRLWGFENRALRRIFGPKRVEVIGGWRKPIYNLYSSPSIIRKIKSMRMILAGHVARMGFWLERQKGIDH
jgi:hypothetical protein